MVLGDQGGVGKAEQEYHYARDECPVIQVGDYEGESCSAEEDIAHKHRAEPGNQVAGKSQFGDAVGVVGAGHNRRDVEIAEGFENRKEGEYDRRHRKGGETGNSPQ